MIKKNISAKNAAERVMLDLEVKLVSGSFPVGSRLPSQLDLMKEYNVGRSTIREALQRLIALGWLQSKPGAGFSVVNKFPLSDSAWAGLVINHPTVGKDIIEFRRMLEGTTAYFAAQRATAEDEKQIRGYLEKLEKSRETDDIHAEAEADVGFHMAIAYASHNSIFSRLLKIGFKTMLHDHITISGMDLRQRNRDVSTQLLMQHQVVYKAICAKQPDEARTAMQSHIDYVRNNVNELEGFLMP